VIQVKVLKESFCQFFIALLDFLNLQGNKGFNNSDNSLKNTPPQHGWGIWERPGQQKQNIVT